MSDLAVVLLREDIAALARAHQQLRRILDRRGRRPGAALDPRTLRCERVARMLDTRIRLKAELLAALREPAKLAAGAVA